MSKELGFSSCLALCVHAGFIFLGTVIIPAPVVFDIERASSSVEIYIVPAVETINRPAPQKVKKTEEPKPEPPLQEVKIISVINKVPEVSALPNEVTEQPPQEKEIEKVAQEVISPKPKPYDVLTSASPKVQPTAESKIESSRAKDESVFADQGARLKAKPNYLQNSPPRYPRLARKRGYEGKILLSIEVLSSGLCGRIKILKSSGYSVLDKAALRAVKKWIFKPALVLNRPVRTWVEIPITFRLKET